MAVGNTNLEWFKDEDVPITFAMAPATNISGWTLAFALCEQAGSAVLVSKTTGAGITITDAVNGIVTVQINSADHATITAGTLLYNLWRTDGGSKTMLASGTATVKPTISL